MDEPDFHLLNGWIVSDGIYCAGTYANHFHEYPPNVKLRGTPTMKSEQRATRDETRDLAMPRQGVSLLNDMLEVLARTGKNFVYKGIALCPREKLKRGQVGQPNQCCCLLPFAVARDVGCICAPPSWHYLALSFGR